MEEKGTDSSAGSRRLRPRPCGQARAMVVAYEPSPAGVAGTPRSGGCVRKVALQDLVGLGEGSLGTLQSGQIDVQCRTKPSMTD